MPSKGNGTNQHGDHNRRIAKLAAKRREHTDKYAKQREDPTERGMSEALAELTAHFNGEEGHRV